MSTLGSFKFRDFRSELACLVLFNLTAYPSCIVAKMPDHSTQEDIPFILHGGYHHEFSLRLPRVKL